MKEGVVERQLVVVFFKHYSNYWPRTCAVIQTFSRFGVMLLYIINQRPHKVAITRVIHIVVVGLVTCFLCVGIGNIMIWSEQTTAISATEKVMKSVFVEKLVVRTMTERTLQTTAGL